MKDTGRPQDVYCGWFVKQDTLLPEVLLTEALMKLKFDTCIRGYEVDQNIRPDATLIIKGKTWHVEMDSGLNTGYAEVKRRLKFYEKVTDPVLWIASSGVRADGIRHRAERIKGTAWFTSVKWTGGRWLRFDGSETNPQDKGWA